MTHTLTENHMVVAAFYAIEAAKEAAERAARTDRTAGRNADTEDRR